METKEAVGLIQYLKNPKQAWWDEKNETLVPMPEKMTAAQMREAILNARCEAGEAMAELLILIEKQQSQIEWLDRTLKAHRHQLETGAYSSKPEF